VYGHHVEAGDGAPPGARRRRPGRPSTRHQQRERILEAGTRLIHAKGFQGTTIQQVADELEFSKAAFYYFVRNKQELLQQIMLRTLTRSLDTIVAIVHGPGPADQKLLRVVDAFVRLVAGRPETFSVYFRERGHLAPPHREAATALERRIVGELRRLYAEGVEAGRLRDVPEEAAVFGLLGMCFWTYEWYRADGRLTPEAVSEAIQALVTHGAIVPS
jgi:TetR/AcrR family transcriptional regulator, cholesterol catabolism regulator